MRSPPCDACRVLTREDCLVRTELLERGEWVCEACDDELTSEQHELDRADAFDGYGAELGPCGCEQCARHREREARKAWRQRAAEGETMGRVIPLRGEVDRDPWRVSVPELLKTEVELRRLHTERNEIGATVEAQCLLVRVLGAIADGHSDPRGLAAAALTVVDHAAEQVEP